MRIDPDYLAKSKTEHGEQTALFCWANMAHRHGFAVANDMGSYGKPVTTAGAPVPQLEWLYAIPNGGERNAVTAARLKAEGVKRGVADICLPVRNSLGYGALYIELKRVDGVPSNFKDEQMEFGVSVIMQNMVWMPCFGWREAAGVIQSYLMCNGWSMSPHQQNVLNAVMDLQQRKAR